MLVRKRKIVICVSARSEQCRKIWLCEYCCIFFFALLITKGLWHCFDSWQSSYMIAFLFFKGHELHEQTCRKWVCGLQQCHVSAAQTNPYFMDRCVDFEAFPTVLRSSYVASVKSWCFPCPSFQSERESGDRNFAIGYYLKEKKVQTTASFFNLNDYKINDYSVFEWLCLFSVFQKEQTWPPSLTSTSR